MSESENRYRQLERTDRRIMRFRAFVGFAIVCMFGFLIAGEVQSLGYQSSNAATLSTVQRLVTEVKADERALAQGNAGVSRIFAEANLVSQELLKGQQVTSQQIADLAAAVAALCQANPACHATQKGNP